MKTGNPNQDQHCGEVQPFDESLCEHLPRRLKAICLGTAEGVSPEDVKRYRAVFAAQANNAQSHRAAHSSSGVRSGKTDIHSAIAITPRPAPTYGVGSELKKLLAELNIPSAWCETCEGRAALMDAGGPQWCLSNRATIIGWLQEAETRFARHAALVERGDGIEPTEKQIAKAKTAQRWRVGWNAARQLLWVNPLDPHGSLINEAVRRAEARHGDPCCEVTE
ncbi:MAG: hypothetical protein KF777_00185 [Planctomycetaceae bacterium]|nr:hypothetical protein [Planctomycetaceae bacterium]